MRTITSISRFLSVWLFAAALFAHGNFDHVIGTVTKSDKMTLTVHTAKGNVEIKLTAATEVTKDTHKFAPEAIKAGMRVVIDVEKGSTEAHSVRVGVQAAR
jgi:hypothetical protein